MGGLVRAGLSYTEAMRFIGVDADLVAGAAARGSPLDAGQHLMRLSPGFEEQPEVSGPCPLPAGYPVPMMPPGIRAVM